MGLPITVLDHSTIWNFVCFRYEHQEIASNCGTMLRECARYEALAKIMLYSDDFYNFFRYVEVSTFDIASDAFSTFKVSLLISSKYLVYRNRHQIFDGHIYNISNI